MRLSAILGAFVIGLLALMPTEAQGDTITKMMDSSGDGLGHPLYAAEGVAVDDSGNAYITGKYSDNVFKITPGGVITQIMDSSGDGLGHVLDGAFGIAIDQSDNVYVTGCNSNNAFKITPGGVITEIIDPSGDGKGNILDAAHGLAVDDSGNVYVTGYLSDNVFRIEPVIVGVEKGKEGPPAFSVLEQNYPNPFNPLTCIKFSTSQPGRLVLRIFDVAGRAVRTLVDGWRQPGVYSEVWDGKADDGSALPSDVYFCSLKTAESETTRKMILLR